MISGTAHRAVRGARLAHNSPQRWVQGRAASSISPPLLFSPSSLPSAPSSCLSFSSSASPCVSQPLPLLVRAPSRPLPSAGSPLAGLRHFSSPASGEDKDPKPSTSAEAAVDVSGVDDSLKWEEFFDTNGRAYYYNIVSKEVTWTKPTGEGVVILPTPSIEELAARATAEEQKRVDALKAKRASDKEGKTGHWLQNLGSDGLPDLPAEPKLSSDPNAPWWRQAMERAHHTLVYSRSASIAAALIAGSALVLWVLYNRRQDAQQAAKQEERRALREQRQKLARAQQTTTPPSR